MEIFNACCAPMRAMLDRMDRSLEGKPAHFEGHPAQRHAFYLALSILLNTPGSSQTEEEAKLRVKLIEYFSGNLNFMANIEMPTTQVVLVIAGKVRGTIDNLPIPWGYEVPEHAEVS